MPFEREYLCKLPEVTKSFQYIHDEIIEEFVPTCRHCKKTSDEHVEGHCYFDSTSWDPMLTDEWMLWRRDVWSNYAAPSSFARSILLGSTKK